MPGAASPFDSLFLGILPYVAFFVFFLVTIQRYRAQTFTYSSLSSQLLENRQHFWSVVPFHYGIIVVLTGHVVAFLFPRQLLLWNSKPIRLYILEVTALVFGLLTAIGLIHLIARRLGNAKVRKVTSLADAILYALLIFQVLTGVYVAIFHPWGSSWFSAAATPYLWSLVKLNPNLAGVAGLPLAAKLHIINAYLVIGFFPFTRLVHILVVPNPYLWRKPQVVRWYGRAGAAAAGK